MWSEPYIRWSKSVRSSENVLLPSGRLESEGSIGLPVSLNQNLWKRVSRHSGPQIENAAELYNFIEKAVSAKAEAGKRAAKTDLTKRALLTTVTPEQSNSKILLNDSKQITGSLLSRKVMISEDFSRGNSSNSLNTEFDQR